jgi:zinc protease
MNNSKIYRTMKRSVLISLLTVICLSLSTFIFAQGINYHPESKVPFDGKVTYGKLENGLTYYIRENKRPEQRAEFYLLVNAGAMQEDEDQNGLAHFCEHMAFNGTKNFEKKEILNYLQSIGMKFGPEINAFTSYDETNYMLQKVPTSELAVVDTALMILYDWANNIAFEDAEIDAERGVIHEEWRTGRSAMYRMMREAYKTLFKDSKYATHDVIGEIELIDNFPYDVLKRFYRNWYRPDLQAIIAVGDFDGKIIEQKIKDLFSQTPMPADAKPHVTPQVPDHKETLVTVQKDKEAQYSMIQLVYKHPVEPNKNLGYYRSSILEELFNSMMNARLQELLQSADPPFVYGYTAYTSFVRSKDAFLSFAIARNNEMHKCLNALLTENERVKQFGFMQTELDRAKAEYQRNIEKEYTERDKQESEKYVWKYYEHFLTSEPTPGIEFDLDFVKQMLPGITLGEINALGKSWITDENRVVALMAPESPDISVPTEAEVFEIINTVQNEKITAYVDKVSDLPLIPNEPTPSKVEKAAKNKELGTIRWTFKNGVQVVLKQTDFKEDEILMTAFSYGGTSLYEVKDLVSAENATRVAQESGLGAFDKAELDKKMAGKIVQTSPMISETQEGFRGSCSPLDLETLLQQVYLYFTAPRMTDDAFQGYIAKMKGVLDNKSADPDQAIWDTAMVTLANYNPRVRPWTSQLLDEANIKRIRSIFKDRFGDPGSFTFYFVGNIDPEKAKPLIEKYLGGLPKVSRTETWKDNGVRPPEGKISKTILRNMQVPKGTVFITYTGTYDFDDFQTRLNLSALTDILETRYVETIREEEGGTYGAAVFEDQQKYPYESFSVTIFFDCDPMNANHLKEIVYNEIEKIKKEGPAEKDFKGVKENKLKTYQENLKQNKYWLDLIKNVDYNQTDITEYKKYEEYVSNLSIEGLKQAANELFKENVVEILLLPENLEDDQVNPMIKK